MKILVVCPLSNHAFSPLGFACCESLKTLGHQADQAEKYLPNYDVCIYISLHQDNGLPKDSTYKIAFNLEPLQMKRWRKSFALTYDQYDCILETIQDNIAIAPTIVPNIRNKKHLFCPIGYHPSFELEPIHGPQRKVTFIGIIPRNRRMRHRQRVIGRIENETEFKVHQLSSAYAPTVPLRQALFNSEIQLNIHLRSRMIKDNTPFSMSIFEGDRIIRLLMSNKCFLISEKSRHCPLTNGEHFIEVGEKSFTALVKYYAERPEERQEIANAGYEFVKQHYRFDQHLQRALEQIDV